MANDDDGEDNDNGNDYNYYCCVGVDEKKNERIIK